MQGNHMASQDQVGKVESILLFPCLTVKENESMDIYQTIIKVMGDLEAVKKDKYNQMQKFNFRGIDDVYNALHPLCAKYGMFSVPTNIFDEKTEERQTRNGGNLVYRLFKVEYTFFASDGTFVTAIVPAEGMDSGDKGTAKAMSSAHKYALLQIFSIPTEDIQDADTSGEDAFPKGSPVYDPQPKQEEKPEQTLFIPQEESDQVALALRFLESSNWPEPKKQYFRQSIPKMSTTELPVLIANLQKDGGR